jgi:AbiU2
MPARPSHSGRSDLFKGVSLSDRISAAKDKTNRVVDHLLYLLELHENNAIILYSSKLSSQIPTSYAANAFNVFQRGLHQFEIVRLCALWDRAEMARENIPTIIELVDHADVIEFLVEETRSHWTEQEGAIISNPSDDPELRKLEMEAMKVSNKRFGQQQAMKERRELRKAIRDARAIMASERLTAIMNLRDKHLAHPLSHTRREQKTGPVKPMKYGDEREILRAMLPIVEKLYCWVSGKSFSFAESRKIDRKNAKALWHGCTFKVLR